MMAPLAKSLLVSDISRPMLDLATAKLEQTGLQNWTVVVADHRALPVANQVADISIAGWSLGYCTTWHAKSWHNEIGKALVEMKRVLRPGGTVIILETLGTGSEKPCPPTDALAMYLCLARRRTRLFFDLDPDGLSVRVGSRGARVDAIFLRR